MDGGWSTKPNPPPIAASPLFYLPEQAAQAQAYLLANPFHILRLCARDDEQSFEVPEKAFDCPVRIITSNDHIITIVQGKDGIQMWRQMVTLVRTGEEILVIE